MPEETQNLIPFAIYSEDDNSLTFYADTKAPHRGELYAAKNQPQKVMNAIFGYIQRGLKTVTDIFTGFETAHYKSSDEVPWKNYRSDIKSVVFDDSFKGIQPISTAYWFYGMENFKDTNIGEVYALSRNTSNVTDMSHMFEGCEKLETLLLSDLNVDNVVDMSYMFAGCKSCDRIELPQGKLNPDTNLQNMFAGCRYLLDFNVADFDISSVKNASVMFIDFDNYEAVYSLPSSYSIHEDLDFIYDEFDKASFTAAILKAEMPWPMYKSKEVTKVTDKYSGTFVFSRKYADTIEFYKFIQENESKTDMYCSECK